MMDDRAICMEAFRQRDGRSGYLYENFRQQAIFMRVLGSAEEKDDWA